MKALLIEDTLTSATLVSHQLRKIGIEPVLARDGEKGIELFKKEHPDLILLDIIMPGMDGFEVARRLKAQQETAHIPVIFMTGLSETEHVVAAFDAGGVDYVVKPIRPREVLVRIASHIQGARQARQARNALDAFGHASITVRVSDGRILWQTPLARKLLMSHFDAPEAVAPVELADWLKVTAPKLSAEISRGQPPSTVPVWAVNQGGRRLSFTLHQPTGDDEWLLVMQESSDQAAMDALSQEFKLTTREGEVLYWVVKGKTNRDIGDILGSSPATVKKQLEHIFAKLGVETRTAAAGLAMSRVAQLKAR